MRVQLTHGVVLSLRDGVSDSPGSHELIPPVVDRLRLLLQPGVLGEVLLNNLSAGIRSDSVTVTVAEDGLVLRGVILVQKTSILDSFVVSLLLTGALDLGIRHGYQPCELLRVHLRQPRVLLFKGLQAGSCPVHKAHTIHVVLVEHIVLQQGLLILVDLFALDIPAKEHVLHGLADGVTGAIHKTVLEDGRHGVVGAAKNRNQSRGSGSFNLPLRKLIDVERLVHKGPVCRPTQSPQLRCPFLELLHCAAACRILANGIHRSLLYLSLSPFLSRQLRVTECLLGGVALQLLVLFPLIGLLLIGVLLDAESLCRFSFHRHHVSVMLHFSLRAFHLFRSPNCFSLLGVGFLTGSLQCLSFIRSGVSGLLLGVDAPREILVLQRLDLLVSGDCEFSLVDLCLLLECVLLVGLHGLLNRLRTILQSLTLFPHLPLVVHHPCGQVLVPLVDVLLGLRSLLTRLHVRFFLLRVLQSALKLCVCQILSAEVLLVPLLELRGDGVTNIGAFCRLLV